MIYLLAIVLAGLMVMVLVSLFKGLNAFRESLDEERDNTGGTGASELQLKQNKMMWARIKYQAAAIVVVMILLSVAN